MHGNMNVKFIPIIQLAYFTSTVTDAEICNNKAIVTFLFNP